MKIFYFLFIVLWLSSCQAKRDVVKNSVNENHPIEGENQAEKCSDAHNNIIWHEAKKTALFTNAALEYSNDFMLFLVDHNRLQKVIELNFKDRNNFQIVLPIYLEKKLQCLSFDLQDSETISRQTQERMNIFSYRGIDANDANNVIRFDFNSNTGLKVYGQVNQKTIIIEPINLSGNRIYICYEKSSSTNTKREFE